MGPKTISSGFHSLYKEAAYENLFTNLTAAVLLAEVIKDISTRMQTLKDEIEELQKAEPPADYTVDTVKAWLQSIREAPDEKAIHLLISRIEAKRDKNNTDFNIESTLKPVLENMPCVTKKDILLLSKKTPHSSSYSQVSNCFRWRRC